MDKEARKPYDVPSSGQLYVRRSSSYLTIGTNFMDLTRFVIQAGKNWPLDDGDDAVSLRLMEDDPASEEAFARANIWIESCKANHPNCIPNQDVPLSTRVLDVQKSAQPDVVSRLISSGKRSKYTALSRCLGDSNGIGDQVIRTCTTESFEELKKGISISRLPKASEDGLRVL